MSPHLTDILSEMLSELNKRLFSQGVITDDVVGRPTELRFFYKEQENDNYVVYFPNFNLTKRDPGMISGVLLVRLKLFAKKLSPLYNFK